MLNIYFTSFEDYYSFDIKVALIYSSNDPINFICAFYGCLFAGIVPLPIDVPLARRVRINKCIYIIINLFTRIGFPNELVFFLVNYLSKSH
jgi:acyl-CoA synthetase (AMP-forming)/AMP-acid ligase II